MCVRRDCLVSWTVGNFAHNINNGQYYIISRGYLRESWSESNISCSNLTLGYTILATDPLNRGSLKSPGRGFLSGPQGKEVSILRIAMSRPLLSKHARKFAENRCPRGNASLSEKCEAFVSLDEDPPGGRSSSLRWSREIRALPW